MKQHPNRTLVLLMFVGLFGVSLLNLIMSDVPKEEWRTQFGWSAFWLALLLIAHVALGRDKDN